MSAAVVLPGSYRLTYRDWLECSDAERRRELLEREIYLTPPPSILHQRISRRLQHQLVLYLARVGTGELLGAPVGVRLSDRDVVEPDLLIVLSEHADRVGDQVVDGAPDVIVEILLPGTARRDLGTKREKYEAFGVGVPETYS